MLEEKDEASVHKLAAMRRTTEMIFGYGKYQCLGKPIAWLEITKVIFEVSTMVHTTCTWIDAFGSS